MEIETEKITNVVESPAAGILAKIVAKEGEVVKITGLLAVISLEGEGQAAVDAVIAQGALKEERPGAAPMMQATKEPLVQPSESSEVTASPLAKKMAKEHGIDLSKIRGTGPEGGIVKEDVMAFIEAGSKAPVTSVGMTPQAEDKSFDGEIVSMSQTRKVIARRTLESIKAPQGTLTREVYLSEILKFRKSIMPEFE